MKNTAHSQQSCIKSTSDQMSKYRSSVGSYSIITVLILIFIHCYGCEVFDQTASPKSNPNVLDYKQDEDSKHLVLNRNSPKHIAVSRASSLLIKGILQQVRSGQTLDFKVSYNVDQALEALADHKVMAAVQLRPLIGSYFDYQIQPKRVKLAETHLWWASKQTLPKLSQKQWHDLLTKKTRRLPNGQPFQLCLRAEPDPLETLWIKLNPQDKKLLKQVRANGFWPIFTDEASLIEHLNQRPEALALFTEGNLKLRAAPFSQVLFEKPKQTKVQAEVYIDPQIKKHSYPRVFKVFLDTVTSKERRQAVQEWGWEP